MRQHAVIALAAAGTLAAMLPMKAVAGECTPQEKVITELVIENGITKVRAYTLGYCSPWKAFSDGLAVAIEETYRIEQGKVVLGAALKAVSDSKRTGAAIAISDAAKK